MLGFSSKTEVNKRFRQSELYKVMNADKTVRADGKQVLAVTLANVLSPATLNFRTAGEVKEIYVFVLDLADRNIPSLFIAALDKAINLHTVFVLQSGGESMLYGAYKEPTDKGVRCSKYYSTQWQPTAPIVPIPSWVASIDDIYTAIIDELIPIAAREGEPTKDFVDRYETILRLHKEIAKMQALVDAEKQAKKRFELNAKLKELQILLEGLN
jgi:hypothetical protein